jgi:uncharacterized protein with NAD-binding domain and iron-sulfur cluster
MYFCTCRFMKKFSVVILTLVYFATSTGATLSMHYCMGKLADWELGQSKSKTCAFCGMEKSVEKDNGCCKDEQKFIRNNNDQKFSETATYTLKLPTASELPFYTAFNFTQSVSVKNRNPVSHAPPNSKGLPIFIRNRAFLI